jgi:hypothetical protein
MTTLRTLKKLLFGETWLVPLGVAAALAVTALVLREFGGKTAAHLGGFVLLAGVIAVLLVSVGRSARGASPRPGPSDG